LSVDGETKKDSIKRFHKKISLIFRCSFYESKNFKAFIFIKRKVRTRSKAPIYHVGQIPAGLLSGKVLQKTQIMKKKDFSFFEDKERN
jgi:hypothetical protein